MPRNGGGESLSSTSEKKKETKRSDEKKHAVLKIPSTFYIMQLVPACKFGKPWLLYSFYDDSLPIPISSAKCSWLRNRILFGIL